jgi:hypothetical protein
MAAGLGFKTFTTGEVLTAADTNGYLMQGVLVFASSAARAAAITSPQEGQYSYLKDTNSTEYYDGAAWIAAPIGDITGVTAGVGITGGGTSGTVTVTNDMATTITAAGDIVVGTGSATYDNLPIGTTGQLLTADTTVSPYKVKWATPAASASGLTFITGATFSSAASVSFPTGTFSSTYLAYKVIFAVSGGTIDAVLSARFRTSGTDNSSAYYYGRFNGVQPNGTAVSVGGGGTTSQACGIIEYTNNAPFFVFDVSNPYASLRTDFAGSAVFCVAATGSSGFGSMAGFYNSTTSFDSMSFNLASGSMSGYYKVYGYQNS